MDFNTITDAEFESYASEQEFRGKAASISTFREGIKEQLRDGDICHGDSMPWSKTHNILGLRPGEVSIWAGINGHGKSQMLGQVLAWLAREKKVLIASMEMTPEATGARIVRQITGSSNPTEMYIDRVINFLEDKMVIYDHVDTVSYDKIYRLIKYSAEKLGVQHVMIDSLAMCGIATDDSNGQKDFVLELENIAKNYQIHIHLVHHMRKKESETTVPDKFDVKGAGELVDLVDNLFIVFRNKSKENDMESGKKIDGDDWGVVPDAYLICAKQRHFTWEGKISLWFDKVSMQYKGGNDNRPLMYGHGF